MTGCGVDSVRLQAGQAKDAAADTAHGAGHALSDAAHAIGEKARTPPTAPPNTLLPQSLAASRWSCAAPLRSRLDRSSSR